MSISDLYFGCHDLQLSYNIVISACADAKLYHEAESLLLGMQNSGFLPDSSTYLAIIRAYAEKKKYAEAEKTIISMQKGGISPTCAHFNLLLTALTRAGLMVEADRIYRRILSSGLNPDLDSKSKMLKGYLDFGCVEEGISFFKRECSSVGPDRYLLSAAIHLYRSAGNESHAEELLGTMRNSGVPFLDKLKVGSKRKANMKYLHAPVS